MARLLTRRPDDQHRWGRTLRRWHDAEAQAEAIGLSIAPFEVWRSRDFLVQLYDEHGHIRVTVNRTHLPNGIDFADGITWDELQQLKAEIGRGDSWAVECYPADRDVVNVANLRHLWLLDEPPAFGWRTAAPTNCGCGAPLTANDPGRQCPRCASTAAARS